MAGITPEELLAIGDEVGGEPSVQQVLTALAACLIDADERGILGGGQASITCPVCGSAIDYSISASNRHILGRCRTAGCVKWMQ